MAKKRKKTKPDHIDSILADWTYDPDAVSVRMVEGSDGRELIQMRIEMGVLQMEISGRPDGDRPEGADTYFDYLQGKSKMEGAEYAFTIDECAEADREFVQYYHRRICWLAMREFRKAVRDADHTLGLMDLCRNHSPDEEWTISHEQYRPFVLFHRIQADALAELDSHGAEGAIAAVNRGLADLHTIFDEDESDGGFDEKELVERLNEFRETLRDKFAVGKTLDEQLADAIAHEEYERAAKLRDAIRAKSGKQI